MTNINIILCNYFFGFSMDSGTFLNILLSFDWKHLKNLFLFCIKEIGMYT